MNKKMLVTIYLRKLPLRWMLLLLLFAGSLFLFGILVHEVLWEQEAAIDQSIFDYLKAHVINDGLTGFMMFITYFASATFLKMAYGMLFVLHLLFKNLMRAIEIASIGVGGYLVNFFMKWVFHRSRPVDPLFHSLSSFSFPSGHAMSGFIFYGTLVYLISKTTLPRFLKYVLSSILILLSLLIGFSRVYLRVHFPSDVVAGFCIGVAWLILSITILERVKQHTSVASL